MEVPKSKWDILLKVAENGRAESCDFQIQTSKLVISNRPYFVVVDKLQKNTVVIDVAFSRDSKIMEKEHEKPGKQQGAEGGS